MGLASGAKADCLGEISQRLEPTSKTEDSQLESGLPLREGPALLLDKNCQSRTGQLPLEFTPSPSPSQLLSWSKQQKRAYQRLNSFLDRLADHQLAWITLTGSSQSERHKLADHHRQLRQACERELGYVGIHYFAVETDEGPNGVLHVFWAWKGEREFWISHKWLSQRWLELHGASNVWIIGNRKLNRKGAAKYTVTQYTAGQSKFVRFYWSWWRTFGMPMAAVWRSHCRIFGRYGRDVMIRRWRELMAGKWIRFPDGSLAQLPGGAEDWGKQWRLEWALSACVRARGRAMTLQCAGG